MTRTYEFKKLKKIKNGDGAEIREQLVLSGLLLLLFEKFKKYALGQVESFYSKRVVLKGDNINYTRGEEFKNLIREYGTGEAGQHSDKPFRAALRWFMEASAINEDEFKEIERLHNVRNNIGHELFGIIADDNKRYIRVEDVCTTFEVYLKITRWWIKEIEATINPDLTEKEYRSVDFDSAESSDTIFLREIIKKALLGNAEIDANLKPSNG